jgi:aminoacrylate peracid reductase
MNEVYKTYFEESFPARYCIKAELVRPEFLVEISSIAHLPKR